MPRTKTGIIVVDPSFKFILGVRGRRSEKWGPPKGHLDESDVDPLDGALREMYEETGIQLTFPTGVKILPRINIERASLFILVLPMTTLFDVIDTHEISEIAWIILDQPPPDQEMTKIMKLCIKRRGEIIRRASSNILNYDLESRGPTFRLNKTLR